MNNALEPPSFFDRLPRSRWLGRAIQAGAAIGFVISVAAIGLLPPLALRFAGWADRTLGSVSAEAGLAAASMHEVALILEGGSRALRAAETSLRQVNGSLQDTGPLLNATAELVGEQAPTTISDTRGALIAAEQGAAAIDGVLRALALLGPITGVSYDPDQSLDEGLAAVAASLEPLPQSLQQVGDELDQSASELQAIGESLEQVGDELGAYADDISGRGAIFSDLAGDLDLLAEQAESARPTIKPLVVVGSVILELLLAGFALGQTAVFFVGRSMQPG